MISLFPVPPRALASLALAAALLGAVALMPVSALAQASANPEIQGLLNRIDRLQRDMNTLQRQVYRGGGGVAAGGAASAAVGAAGEPNLAAAMQVRLDEIETQMRAFTGRLEESNHAIAELSKKFETLTSDIDLRLKALEARGGGAPAASSPAGPATPPAAAASPVTKGILGTLPLQDLPPRDGAAPGGTGDTQSASVLPAGTPGEQYHFATAYLAKSDWAGAERALEAFIVAHPKDSLAGNAQYWLGESFYVRGDFNNAALAFAKGYKDYPKNPKGPDNLLKLGLSLANLKKPQSACTTLDRVGKDFPNASAAIKSRVAAERKKLRCR